MDKKPKFDGNSFKISVLGEGNKGTIGEQGT